MPKVTTLRIALPALLILTAATRAADLAVSETRLGPITDNIEHIYDDMLPNSYVWWRDGKVGMLAVSNNVVLRVECSPRHLILNP